MTGLTRNQAPRGAATPGAAVRDAARRQRVARVGIAAAFTGVAAITAGSVVAALAYRGTAGEAYNPLNHFVSELGEEGVSALGPLFNIGLIAGGIGFAVFMAALALSSTGRLRYAYGVIGVLAGIAGSLVGIFPMNHRDQHALAALTFFDLGWIAVALASIDFVRRPDPRFPRWLAGIGALTVAAFIAFLVDTRVDPWISGMELAAPGARPGAWALTSLEWAVIVGILAWTLAVAWCWRRALRRGGGDA